jgi:predicted nucleic acid-binding protein
MARRCFLDTNVLIYSVDRADPVKQEQALEIIARHAKAKTGVISTQVLQEFLGI